MADEQNPAPTVRDRLAGWLSEQRAAELIAAGRLVLDGEPVTSLDQAAEHGRFTALAG